MHARRLTFGYLFFGLLSIGVFYISGIQTLSAFWLGFIIYSIIFYIIHIIWSVLRKKQRKGIIEFYVLFIYKFSVSAILLLFICGTFVVYHTIIFPAKIPLYTLSNGEKTIKFQAMSHIASIDFYKKVQQEIYNSKKQGYILFFEGVQSGTHENQEAFNKALGVNFEPGLYENLSSLYGVVSQDNEMFLNLVNNKDYNIDLNMDQVMEIYNKKTLKSGSEKDKKSLLQSDEIIDINAQVIETLSELNQKELLILRYINQSFLNFMIKNDAIRDAIIAKLGNQDIFSVILDDRNIHLAQEIINNTNNKIFITYGLMHFSGVLDILQQQDAHWEIIDTEMTPVIRSVSE